MRPSLLPIFFAAASCAHHASPAPTATTGVTGTWLTSTTSYDDASHGHDATRFTADGHVAHGSWDGHAFTAAPPVGPSPGFVPTYELDPAQHQIHFAEDGADEYARYTLDSPDRWKTDTTSGDPVTVYYVRVAK